MTAEEIDNALLEMITPDLTSNEDVDHFWDVMGRASKKLDEEHNLGIKKPKTVKGDKV
jgi:hypothetical protein